MRIHSPSLPSFCSSSLSQSFWQVDNGFLPLLTWWKLLPSFKWLEELNYCRTVCKVTVYSIRSICCLKCISSSTLMPSSHRSPLLPQNLMGEYLLSPFVNSRLIFSTLVLSQQSFLTGIATDAMRLSVVCLDWFPLVLRMHVAKHHTIISM